MGAGELQDFGKPKQGVEVQVTCALCECCAPDLGFRARAYIDILAVILPSVPPKCGAFLGVTS